MLRTRLTILASAFVLVTGGAALADHLAYRLRVSSAQPPTVGQTSRLYLRVVEPDGDLVPRFDDLHTQPLHLIAVSQDLEDFQHVHPRLSPYGYLSTQLRFTRPRPYTLFAEFDPQGPAGEHLVRTTLRPVGAQAGAAQLDASQAFDGELTRRVVRGATRLSLVGHMGQRLRAGIPATLHVQVDDTGGAPAALEDWLGMPAHAIAVAEDLSQFLHLHGMLAPASGGMGGAVDGHGGHGGHGDPGAVPPSTAAVANLGVPATFPRQGLYRLWVQVQRAGRVITASFVVRVL